MSCRTWSRAVRLLSSLAAEERRGLVIVASINQSVCSSISPVYAVDFESGLGLSVVWDGLESHWIYSSVANRERGCQKVIAEAGCGRWYSRASVCRTRAYYLAIRCGNCWRPLLDHLQQPRAAAASQLQVLGKTHLETRRFHVLPGTCLSPAAIGLRRDARSSVGRMPGATVGRRACRQTCVGWGLTYRLPVALWLCGS